MAETFFDVTAPAVAILRGGEPLDIVAGGGRATAIAWPGMGSRFRSMHRIELEPGGQTMPLRHGSEAVYLVAEGAGRVGELRVDRHEMVYVPKGSSYRFVAAAAMTIYGGPCPPDPSLYGLGEGLPADGEGEGAVRILDAERDGVVVPMISKQARLVVWPGTGAEVATMNLVVLEPGEENQPHAHENSDDTIAILEGEGSIDDLSNGGTYEFSAGDVVFVRAGIQHKVKANRGVHIVSAGGPCPPDYGMLRALGLA